MISVDELKRDFSIEVAAMVLACRVFAGTATDKEMAAFIAANNIDWKLLHRTAAIHQVKPIIFKVLYKHEMPDEVKSRLQAECMQITFRNLEHAKEMVRIYELLEQQKVTAIPYKGSVYGLEYYKDIGLREFSDIDFLINADLADLEEIIKAFENSGYVDKSNVPDDFKEVQFKNTREYYFDLYEKERRKFHVEFHWLTASQVFDFSKALPNSLLFEGLGTCEVYGKKIKSLNDTHHFMAMAAHHGLNQQWKIMKYVMDMAMIIKNGGSLDWEEINATSRAYGFNNAVSIGVYIADSLLGVRPYSGVQVPPTGPDYLHSLLGSDDKSRKTIGDIFRESLKIKDNFGDRMKMAVKYLRYTATPSILDYKFVRLPKGLYFLYLFIKPVRLIAESVGKNK